MAAHRFAVASLGLTLALLPAMAGAQAPDAELREQVSKAMRRAAKYYREDVAVKGGYVYYYSPDLQRRLGEGVASPTEVWVQPPGTPTVGMAYLTAYRATGDAYYLDAARETAGALIYGQLASGGWTNVIDFDPRGKRVGRYRNGKGRGRDISSLDDGITQSALRFLMRLDQVLKFKDAEVHDAAKFALDALLKAQFPNGGFPQVWLGPVEPQPVVKASYPDYDWRTENRIKQYWSLYTLNDGLAGSVADTLLEAAAVYDDERSRRALAKLGDFLLLAQMPEPQPAWAQQYDYQMRPTWARKFEPAAISGRESQDAIETLLKIYRHTRDAKYLRPVPRALAYLKRSLLRDGQLARFYELRTNRPLYMTRKYELTYDDGDVPGHYGWKGASHLDELERQYAALKASRSAGAASTGDASASLGETRPRDEAKLAAEARAIVAQLDAEGRWMSIYKNEGLVGQPKFREGERYLSSAVFSGNLETLSAYLEAAAARIGSP